MCTMNVVRGRVVFIFYVFLRAPVFGHERKSIYLQPKSIWFEKHKSRGLSRINEEIFIY